ncbi:hypothetical protein LX32DRAFT_636263 [Colletotrichum zoysiae]|uniref:Uncharacterized protein n=1 Tax=Colletotrichum zoysiae TaxID=1216348 RepID=A0AAD9HR30_9PEZI|nr:hypothetical protein LX32DRAFT_636263 [Colletotrichum zoysiae]
MRMTCSGYMSFYNPVWMPAHVSTRKSFLLVCQAAALSSLLAVAVQRRIPWTPTTALAQAGRWKMSRQVPRGESNRAPMVADHTRPLECAGFVWRYGTISADRHSYCASRGGKPTVLRCSRWTLISLHLSLITEDTFDTHDGAF